MVSIPNGIWISFDIPTNSYHFVRNHLKSRQICPDFEWFSLRMFWTIAIAWPFEKWTIKILPSKSLDFEWSYFRFPLYQTMANRTFDHRASPVFGYPLLHTWFFIWEAFLREQFDPVKMDINGLKHCWLWSEILKTAVTPIHPPSNIIFLFYKNMYLKLIFSYANLNFLLSPSPSIHQSCNNWGGNSVLKQVLNLNFIFSFRTPSEISLVVSEGTNFSLYSQILIKFRSWFGQVI